MEWILKLHPLPPWMEEVLKTSERACTVRAYLGWKHHEALEWILQLHPLPPWIGEVLKTSQRVCTVRAYLGWKHHEAPWTEYYNSTPSPHGWERYLKEGLHSDSLSWLKAPWSTMEWILQLHPLRPWMGEVLKRGPAQWQLIIIIIIMFIYTW